MSASSSLKIRHLGSGGVGMLKGCVHPGPSCIAVYVVIYIVVFYRCPGQTKLSIFVSLSWGHLRNRRADGNGNDGHCDSGDDDDNDDHHHNVRLVAMMIQTKTEMVMVAMKTKKTTTD